MRWSRRSEVVCRCFGLSAKHEVDRSDQAQPSPDEIKPEWLAHIEDCEWNENKKRDDFLQDFQLAQAELRIPDAICGHLEEIFEKRNTPACEGSDIPLLCRSDSEGVHTKRMS
jgi:hypothetical protein